MNIKQVINGLNKNSGHEKRGFTDEEFALACIRTNFTLEDGDYAMCEEADGTTESQWSMFRIGCAFIRKLAVCFLENKEPNPSEIFDDLMDECEFSLNELYKEKNNG